VKTTLVPKFGGPTQKWDRAGLGKGGVGWNPGGHGRRGCLSGHNPPPPPGAGGTVPLASSPPRPRGRMEGRREEGGGA
jgi:hypothetical protein